MRRLVTTVRFWLWRAAGTKGHLPQCRPLRLVARSERTGDALMTGWWCAPGCPARAREDRKLLQRAVVAAKQIQKNLDEERVA